MKTCILIAAHNESQVIEATLKTCNRDTFVADDDSTDRTYSIAKKYARVIKTPRLGKGQATKALIDHFDILNNYDAFVMLDADSLLLPNTVDEFEKALGKKVAGAVGQLRNDGNNAIAKWRSVQYALIYKMYRKGMATVNAIHVLSGTCSIWKSSAVKRLSWEASPVEDMDLAFQLHRKKLGRLAYAPKAIVLTQEPANLKDYRNQLFRWFRGYWQTMAKYNVPFRFQTLDMGQALFAVEAAFTWTRILLLPFWAILPLWIRLVYFYDILFLGIIVIVAALIKKKPSYILYMPVFFFFYIYDILLNGYSFLTFRKLKAGVWVSPERRQSV